MSSSFGRFNAAGGQQVRLSPSSEAERLATQMSQSDETMWTVLDETLDSAEKGQILESGRTACGDATSLQGPLSRFPSSVELAECPRQVGGTWHTHVTPDQLRRPENSLPDIANVMYGDIDASIVVGTQSAEAVVAASDQESMVQRFNETVGLDASGVSDVASAILSGDIANPPAARQRVRSEMSPLFFTFRTGYGDLDSRVDDVMPGNLRQSGVSHHVLDSYQSHFVATHCDRMKWMARRNSHKMQATAQAAAGGVDLRTLTISTVIGNVVGNTVDNVLF